MSFEIPIEEVKRMKPEDFIGTYTYHRHWGWIQRNEMVDEDGDLRGLTVWWHGKVYEEDGWVYDRRLSDRKHYRILEGLAQDCPHEELLNLFLKEL